MTFPADMPIANNIEELAELIEELSPSTHKLDRNRPYNGQAHTNHGIRGKTLVEGLTMRDIYDCYIRACFLSSGLVEKEWPDSIYQLPWNEMDPIAISQNLTCEIERVMGIFPNVPPLTYE